MKIKRTISIILISVILTLQFSWIQLNNEVYAAEKEASNVATIANENQYWSDKNAPVLYGTTSIKVPAGTKIDYKHDVRFRVFAKDNEDGDITSKIEATDNFPANYTEKESGSYTITYKITDSDGNVSTLNVPVEIRSSTEIELQKTMYSLPSVDHLNNLGYTRGNNMDRQTIGIFVEAGASFQMKKQSNGNMTVKLERNDSQQESAKTLTTNNEWTTIQNVITTNTGDTYYDVVPSVKTLYKESGKVTYDVKWDSTDSRIKTLHYYHEGDGLEYQETFLKEWEDDVNSYAMVDGLSMMVLIPYQDHDHMFYKPYPGGKPYNSFEHFFSWWNDIMDDYDEMIGLSYTPDVYYNQNVKTKYFVKANAHGAGAAYYNSGDHVGINSTSDWSMFQVGWGGLHEVGHGYQGNLGGGGLGMPLGEVGVNIFGYYIQDVAHKFIYNESWLNVKGQEKNYNNSRLQGYGYYDNGNGNLGAAAMLYSLVNALDYFEDFSQSEKHEYKEAYAYINKYFRKHYYETGEKLQTADAWCLALAEKYNVNLVLYFESWGVKVSDYVKEELMMSDAELVYYLRDLVGDDATAATLKPDSNVGIYDLVSTSELKELSNNSITGNIELEFKIDDISEILGKTLYIADGENIVKKIKVTDWTMTVNLPAGAYKVAVPKPNGVYDFDNLFVLVSKEKTNYYDITYDTITDISFGNDVLIKSRGYWGEDKVPFAIEVVGNQMKFSYQGTYPNSGSVSSQDLFSSLTVYDNNGNVVYDIGVNGGYYDTFLKNNEAEKYIDVQVGYKLKIYYRGNKSDIKYYSTLTGELLDGYGITDTTIHARTYIVTEYGLIPEDILGNYPDEISDKVYEMYKDRLDSYIENYKEGKTQDELLDPFSPNKGTNVIKNALKNLKEEDLAEYTKKLKGISTGEAPVIKSSEGQTFEFDISELPHRTIEDVYQMITVTDKEDGVIYENGKLTARATQKGANVTFESDVDWEHIGTYHVTITAIDSNDNITILVLEAVLVDNSDDTLIDISKFKIKVDGAENGFVYTGEEIKPTVTIVDDSDHILTLDTDYNITYSNNINSGTATITITAIKEKGIYEGTIETTFKIAKAQPTEIPSSVFVVENDIDYLDEITLPDGWYWEDDDADRDPLEVGDNNLVLIYDGDDNHEAMKINVVVTRKDLEETKNKPTPEPPAEDPDEPPVSSSGQPWGEDNPNHGNDFTEDPASDVRPNDDGNGEAKENTNSSDNNDKKEDNNKDDKDKESSDENSNEDKNNKDSDNEGVSSGSSNSSEEKDNRTPETEDNIYQFVIILLSAICVLEITFLAKIKLINGNKPKYKPKHLK